LLCICVVSWWIFFLEKNQRMDAVKIVTTVVGTLTAVVVAVERVWRTRRPADPRPVDILADLLAPAVHEQWRKTAAERMLVTPAPIRLSWSLSEKSVPGSAAAAIGDPDLAPVFPPLPDQSRVTEAQLRAGGRRGELFAVYAGIASGRMVVVGPPGAGKSGTAVLLLLDALAHRNRVEDNDRAQVPVPVLLTPHGWDPTVCSVQDWFAARLAADYPMFQHRGGHAEAAALVAAGAVTLILDGFDEMDVAHRPAALQALNDATFRVVVLARGDEMAQTAGAAWLVEAVALHLDPVAGAEGADYLQRACTGPPPVGWTQLLTYLQHYPDCALTSGLSTPLA
jgi:hypothetical protein